MVSRLVVVSNRVGPVRDAARAGGLAVALVDALKRTGGLWFGWSGKVSARTRAIPQVERHGTLSLATVDLTQDDYEHFYNGFCNGALWPLCHYRIGLTEFTQEDYRGYVRVNHRFARSLAPLLQDDDLIWVHDYHLIPCAEELRRLGCGQAIGFFLHIPFPAPEVLATLPVHEPLVRALFAYDVVGFQTEADRRCFLNYVADEAGGEVGDDGRATAFGRTVRAGVFPIGIDTITFKRFAVSKEAVAHRKRMDSVLHRRLAIIGVDRLDYTKGLPERFRAFQQLLKTYPENRGRVSYVQIAPTSRGEVQDYMDIRRELEGLSGSINGEYAEFDWTPLRYINRPYSRRALAGIFRTCRIGLVTPLRDGMNLVAKEYVAAQSARDPGVLVLSRFAGAAQGADGALVVNPYDVDAVAEALQRALNMPLVERKQRWRRLFDTILRYDVFAWREGFLATLASARDAAHRG